MEKAIFPLKYMNQTQGVNGGYSHQGTFAIDYGTKNGTALDVYAPFTGTIKKIYTKSGNFVWLESNEKVAWADGSVDYMTVMTGHDNNVSDLYVGKIIKQGEVYYRQGNAGNATGVHVHIEVGKGKFTGSGWYENSYGNWTINNGVHPVKAFYVSNTEVKNNGGYAWVNIIGMPVSRDNKKNQIEVMVNDLRCRKSPNGTILGYVNKGIYNILDSSKNGNYTWYMIGSDNWIAYDPSWAKLYLISNQSDNSNQAGDDSSDNNTVKPCEGELIFTVPKDDMYAIKLYAGEKVYIVK